MTPYFVNLVFTSQIVFYLLQSLLILSSYLDVVLTLSIECVLDNEVGVLMSLAQPFIGMAQPTIRYGHVNADRGGEINSTAAWEVTGCV